MNNHLLEIEIHRRAAITHQACADYHVTAATLIEENHIQEAKMAAKNALNTADLALRGTLAACVEDMAWEK